MRGWKRRTGAWGLALSACFAFAAAPCAWAAHGYAAYGEMKYPPGFSHFGYVNPQAPKGGELVMVSGLRYSTIDKLNPFIIKGTPPSFLWAMLFDTLLARSLDETSAAYNLLAQDTQLAADGLSITFKLRPEARFHNGDPVTAADVKYSVETFKAPYIEPEWSLLVENVASVEVLDALTVRMRFKRVDRQAPLAIGTLPIISPKWGMGADRKPKPFDQTANDTPVGSGPYKIGTIVPGRDITYVRDPNYWGRALNVNRGLHNFDRVTVKIYRDNTAQLEALKAGEFDFMRFFSAGDWVRRTTGRRFASGELVKVDLEHREPDDYYGYYMNTRRAVFKDRRVREAVTLAMDYEWMARQLFYNRYVRTRPLFGNTECEAKGLPSADELAVMEPLRSQLDPGVFETKTLPPRTDGDSSLRANLRKARDLLKEAGWTLQGGVLRNAQGQPLRFEYMDSTEGRRGGIIEAWKANLAKLGIELVERRVDFAIFQARARVFDFDMMSLVLPTYHEPRPELLDMFGSAAADKEDSFNYSGVKEPAVDALLAQMMAAPTKAAYLPACRALDRVIARGRYIVPAWTSPSTPIVYNQRVIGRPEVVPAHPPEAAKYNTWPITTWWSKTAAPAR